MTALRMRSDESGAVLPIFGLLLIMLLLFAAIAVDLGAAWAQRRTSQTAADAGVMAAALEYLRPIPPDETGIFDLVNDYANANLTSTALTFDDWAACVDDGRPIDYQPLGSDGTWHYLGAGGPADLVDCISLKQVNNEPAVLRVRLPNNDVPTGFAGLIGIDSIAVSAFAEAEIRYLAQAKILPFSLPSNPQPTECLGTPPSGLLPNDEAPCTGPAQGNFGMIDSPWFGAPAPYGTDSDSCPHDPNFKNRTPTNLALGLDHIITAWPATLPDPIPADGTSLGNNHEGADSCDNSSSPLPPYVLLTETGNTQTGSEIMHDGFLGTGFGTENADGRLRQTLPGTTTSQFSGPNLENQRLTIATTTDSIDVDNVGLWEYLDFTQTSGDCDKTEFTGKEGRELTDQMVRCVTTDGTDGFGNAGPHPDPGPVFIKEIVDSPRFALVPVLNYTSGSQFGTKWWAVKSLQPVYVQTTWFRCGQPTGDCLLEPDGYGDYVHPNAPPPPPPTTTTTSTTAPTTTTTTKAKGPKKTTTTTTTGPTTTTTTTPTTTTTTLALDHGKSVFFNPGEGTVEPCLLKGSTCDTPKSLTMAGSSAFVIDRSWLDPSVANAIGSSAPYDVYLRR